MAHYCIHNDKSLSVWMIPFGTREELFIAEVYRRYIIPVAEQERLEIIRNTNKYKTENEWITVDDVRIVLTFDGAIPQIKEIMVSLAEECKAKGIEMVKWAAASSLITQPLDVGDMHKIIHNTLKSSHYRYDDNTTTSTPMKLFIENVLMMSAMAQGSKLTYAKFLRHAEAIIQKSYSIAANVESWRIPGYFPRDEIAIMTGIAGWSDYPVDQKVRMLRTIPKLKPFVVEKGKISDQEIHNMMVSEGCDMALLSEPRLGDDVSTSNDRCVWLNNESYLAKYTIRNLEQEEIEIARELNVDEERIELMT
eukprot:CAMPEP_0196763960 /NCGR_PEP_ID=MMETSP1095-20130614/5106_1 /TAXON_ID=96789 ORGANISM="Chromulina nebulosa, Strain UTEXLB2642" /NCGR_SAMPLE_ID=MMETSP1095 /ASSEMBLY_ACC=CAM_ASM_000446 /LENGTH=307 /DNA_ID=CAMNT_0042118333 /DNA_START=800 /DNA_END=1724 /DNA_ORIENTATION=+